MMYLLLFIAPLLLGFWAQSRVTKAFAYWSQIPNEAGVSGAEVARAILDRNGLHSVPINETPGELSDHYDPANRSVNLSQGVYGQRTVAAAAIAAHEVGHAIQHARSYAPMTLRSAVFPAAMMGTRSWMFLVMGGAVLAAMEVVFGMWLILLGIALYSFAVLFHLVTLPVEFDASRRAKIELTQMQLTPGSQAAGTAAVLNAAAMTYVAGALASVAQLVYFISMFVGND